MNASETLLEKAAAAGRREWYGGRRAAFILFLLATIGLLSLLGLKHGALDCSLGDLFRALSTAQGDETLQYFVRHLRLPRIISALAVGGALAVSGLILQNVLNNPLASSFTLGLSQGAAFGASVALISLPGASLALSAGLGLVTACAFAGSLLTSLLVMSFTLIRGLNPQGLILAGVASLSEAYQMDIKIEYLGNAAHVLF